MPKIKEHRIRTDKDATLNIRVEQDEDCQILVVQSILPDGSKGLLEKVKDFINGEERESS